MTTYRVVMAPKGYGPNDTFANAFLLRIVELDADSERDAIFRAAIKSHVSEFECGDFTVRSVDVVQPEPAPSVTMCGYVAGTIPTVVDCARSGCDLCAGELDLAGDDSYLEG